LHQKGTAVIAAMRLSPLIMVLAFTGCGSLFPSGTQLILEGTICGQPIKLSLNDRTDRQAFSIAVDCGGGAGVVVTTSEKGTAAVAAVDADIIKALLQRIPTVPVVP